MQPGGQLQGGSAQALCLLLLPPPAGQLRGEERQGGEQQPRVVVDVGLDEAVAVADADGHHRVDGDPVGGEVTGGVQTRERKEGRRSGGELKRFEMDYKITASVVLVIKLDGIETYWEWAFSASCKAALVIPFVEVI